MRLRHRTGHKSRVSGRPGLRLRFHRRWIAAATLLCLLGCSTSTYAATLVVRQHHHEAARNFAANSAQVAATLRLALQHESDLAIGITAFLSENPHATNADLSRWARSIRAFARYNEVESFGNVLLVKPADLAAHAAYVRSQGLPFTLTSSAHAPFYCFVSAGLVRSGASTAAAPPGLNICDGPQQQQVLELRDSGADQYTPFGDMLAIGTPYYRGGGVPATIGARRRDFLGFAGTVVRPQTVLATALTGHPGMRVTMAYRRGSVDVAFSSTPSRSRPELALDLGGGWTAELSGAPTVPSLLHGGTALGLLAGCTVTTLLSLLVLALGTGRKRALRTVEERTREIQFRSLHDGLTGLPNRILLLERMEEALRRARRCGTDVAVMFLDLDGFKAINDTYGHAIGDQLLRAVSGRLSEVVRETDTLGRLGGDEFVIVLEGESLAGGPEVLAARALAAVGQPLVLDHANLLTVHPRMSVGVATGLRDTADELLRDADLAMYEVKKAGKNSYAVFVPPTEPTASQEWAALCQRTQDEASTSGLRAELPTA